MTKKEVSTLLAWAAANFPGMQEKDLRPTAALWEKMLSDMPYSLAESALMKIIATSKFFPTVAEIRQAAEQLKGESLPSADQAWLEVMEAIKSVGSYGIPVFSHEAIKNAVSTIGWTNICRSENIGVERGHFLKVYEAIRCRHEDAKINQQVLSLVSATSVGLLTGGRTPEKVN